MIVFINILNQFLFSYFPVLIFVLVLVIVLCFSNF